MEIDIENLTLKQIRELTTMFGKTEPPACRSAVVAGQKVYVRTVTFYYLGEVVSVDEHELVLKDASWVASTGIREAEFLAGGPSPASSEIEPYQGNLILSRGAVVSISTWHHALPRKATP